MTTMMQSPPAPTATPTMSPKLLDDDDEAAFATLSPTAMVVVETPEIDELVDELEEELVDKPVEEPAGEPVEVREVELGVGVTGTNGGNGLAADRTRTDETSAFQLACQ